MQVDGPLLLVGCGKMGKALLSGWLARGLPAEDVTVVEPHAQDLSELEARGVTLCSSPDELWPGFSPALVVFAVKPQVIDSVLPDYRRFAGNGQLFLSIAAGKTVQHFAQALGADCAIVRATPNTPAAVGRGMSVLYANRNASDVQRTLCSDLLAPVGEIAWIADEAQMDAVTAVSGGGPAYVFLLIECLAQAGRDAGLPEDLAMHLAEVTVSGSGELVRQSDEPVSTLREHVTSPGGTTLEALKVLMADDGLQPLMTRAIAAATRRSRELAN